MTDLENPSLFLGETSSNTNTDLDISVSPSKYDYILPCVLLVVTGALYFGKPAWHEVVPGDNLVGSKDQALSYPIMFGSPYLANPTYCYAKDILSCKANITTASICCTSLQEGYFPSNQVPNGVLIGCSLVLPVAMFALFCYYVGCSQGKLAMRAEFSSVFLGFFQAFCINVALMAYFKRTLGVPRPNFWSLSALIEYNSEMYAGFEEERYQNIPSGHSSCSMTVFLYLSYYMAFKANNAYPVSVNSRTNTIRQWAVLSSYIPIVVALWVAATRVQDYWHSPPAVILGMLLGVLCASQSWFCLALPYLLLQSKEGDKRAKDKGKLPYKANRSSAQI
jgi:membrane-associated phospholipid phosphatase